ncbi:MAG: PaaI family thioesterase [Pseudomonadota bacterium]|nr:MAG: PaaI family thioesterase [Pseudomonadota bacterium]
MEDVPISVHREIFKSAPFIRSIGLELDSVSDGRCVTSLEVRQDHLQQNGVVHAGVLATLADHTAGGAASTAMSKGSYPLTAEFKINLLRPATGNSLRCVSGVIKAGRSLVVVESDVFSIAAGGETLCAKAIVTLSVVSGN